MNRREEYAALALWWAEESARLRAEGLARTEGLCRRDGLPEAATAIDVRIRDGYEMLRAARDREEPAPTMH